MGLDSVEILMKVENTFGIRIPNQEAQHILTVRDLHDTAWRQFSDRHNCKCKSQAIFYKLRTSAYKNFDFPRISFKLETSPEDVFPRLNRRNQYLYLKDVLDLKFPKLVLSKTWSIFLTAFGFMLITGLLVLAFILTNFFNYNSWMFLMPVFGIIITILISSMLESKRTVINAPTIKGFTQQVLALNYSKLATETGVNRKEMETVINHIIADMAGLHSEEVTPEKRISDDLGID
jgi:acyl carrier protein